LPFVKSPVTLIKQIQTIFHHKENEVNGVNGINGDKSVILTKSVS